MAAVVGVDPRSKATLVDFNQASENHSYALAFLNLVITPTLVDYR
jgi:hypothetical protein